jgi:hypothetical protein
MTCDVTRDRASSYSSRAVFVQRTSGVPHGGGECSDVSLDADVVFNPGRVRTRTGGHVAHRQRARGVRAQVLR